MRLSPSIAPVCGIFLIYIFTEKTVEPSPWHLQMAWPTCTDIQLKKTCKMLNLSERRFGAHIDAKGVWKPITKCHLAKVSRQRALH